MLNSVFSFCQKLTFKIQSFLINILLAQKIMAHEDGWIEAYELLENGHKISDALFSQISHNRSGLGETMLHWYAIEGDPEVLERIIALGFDVDTTNNFKRTPLFESAQTNRWDNVEVLLRNGADPNIRDENGESVEECLEGQPQALQKLQELTSRWW